MKRLVISELDKLKRKYSLDLLQYVKYCRDEIRGLKMERIDQGYDESEVEDQIGTYLDEVYGEYFNHAQEEFNVSEEEFDHIYQVLEESDDFK